MATTAHGALWQFHSLTRSGQPTPNADPALADADQWAMHAQQRVGWQPSRFLTDRAQAERALELAEQLGSVNAAAAQLGTTWPSLRNAFTRHGLGMPARNPEAVRQRAIAAASAPPAGHPDSGPGVHGPQPRRPPSSRAVTG
jgi:hypothetical protein